MQTPIVLVHGAWVGAWSWSSLQHELDLIGRPSYAIDLPGRGASTALPTGLAGDVAATVAALEAIGRPVVLVGHSYGGAVVSGAAARSPLVAGVAYVAAFALRAGESVMGFLRAAPRHHVSLSELMQGRDDGTIALDPARASSLYVELPAAVAAAHAARHVVQPADTFTGVVEGDPFGALPTRYVLCEADDAVHPEHQRILAARCDSTVTVPGGHFPMMTRPGELAAILDACPTRDD